MEDKESMYMTPDGHDDDKSSLWERYQERIRDRDRREKKHRDIEWIATLCFIILVYIIITRFS
ncbi:MAG: hypothetical protein SPL94_07440, partial [Oribacterium sp.]|jgi:hypothetical protein|nr:hypothetical protein [Oribacterium sp.]